MPATCKCDCYGRVQWKGVHRKGHQPAGIARLSEEQKVKLQSNEAKYKANGYKKKSNDKGNAISGARLRLNKSRRRRPTLL
jgi:hypothetical protein